MHFLCRLALPWSSGVLILPMNGLVLSGSTEDILFGFMGSLGKIFKDTVSHLTAIASQ